MTIKFASNKLLNKVSLYDCSLKIHTIKGKVVYTPAILSVDYYLQQISKAGAVGFYLNKKYFLGYLQKANQFLVDIDIIRNELSQLSDHPINEDYVRKLKQFEDKFQAIKALNERHYVNPTKGVFSPLINFFRRRINRDYNAMIFQFSLWADMNSRRIMEQRKLIEYSMLIKYQQSLFKSLSQSLTENVKANGLNAEESFNCYNSIYHKQFASDAFYNSYLRAKEIASWQLASIADFKGMLTKAIVNGNEKALKSVKKVFGFLYQYHHEATANKEEAPQVAAALISQLKALITPNSSYEIVDRVASIIHSYVKNLAPRETEDICSLALNRKNQIEAEELMQYKNLQKTTKQLSVIINLIDNLDEARLMFYDHADNGIALYKTSLQAIALAFDNNIGIANIANFDQLQAKLNYCPETLHATLNDRNPQKTLLLKLTKELIDKANSLKAPVVDTYKLFKPLRKIYADTPLGSSLQQGLARSFI